MRDQFNHSKLWVYKIVKALVNKKLFIFYNRRRNFHQVFDTIVETFSFVGIKQSKSLSPGISTIGRRLSRSMSKVWKNTNEGYVISDMDIIFCIINMSLNRFESICTTFKKETERLVEVFDRITLKDRHDIIRQGYILKQLTTEMIKECENKTDCLKTMDLVAPLDA